MKNIVKYIFLSYNVVVFLLVFLFWKKWEPIWHENFSIFIPKLSVYIVPTLLAFSSVLLIVIGWKNTGLILGFLGLLPIEYVLYIKNFVYIDDCPCGRLYTFLDTEIHFWMNTVVVLFILIGIVVNVFYNRRIIKVFEA